MDSPSERESSPDWVVGESVSIKAEVDSRRAMPLFVVDDVMFPAAYYRVHGFACIECGDRVIWIREDSNSTAPGFTLVSHGWRIDVEIDRSRTLIRAERQVNDTQFESRSLGRFDRALTKDEVVALTRRFVEAR